MMTLKLKFKIEILNRIIKYSANDEIPSKNTSNSRTNKSSKQSGRTSNSKSYNDIESIPGYEQEISKVSYEEKEEINTLLKNIDFPIITNIFNILQTKQLYQKLKSKLSLEIIRQIFKDIIQKKSDSACSDYLSSEDTLFINDECELYFSFKDIININEIDAMDLFDMFRFNEYSAFTEQNFIILIYLLAGFECGNFEDYMLLFNTDLFCFVAGGERFINLSRLKDFGRLFSISENVLLKTSISMNLDLNSLIDAEKFKQFYMFLSKSIDEQVKILYGLYSNQNTSKSKSHSSQDKVKSNGCMNKACNIL